MYQAGSPEDLKGKVGMERRRFIRMAYRTWFG